MKTFRVLFILLAAFVYAASPAFVEADTAEKIGVVLMHGKSGTAGPTSLLGKLIAALRKAGIIVIAPDMPWSRSRVLDKSYEASMAEIDEAVKKLKAAGATKIVVGGHSMGANAALGYGARRDGLAGILAIAPGHVPDVAGFQRLTENDYQIAEQMVAAGKGGETAAFKDINKVMGDFITVRAADYLSWFDPDGPAVMPKNAARLRPGTALMWILGEKDNMLRRGDGEDYAFTKAPPHPKSAYAVVKGGHRATPTKGRKKIIAWLKGL